MRLLFLTMTCALCASAVSAGPLTCWYNSSGVSKGADGGSMSVPQAQWGLPYAIPNPNGSGSDDYAYLIILPSYESGSDCPDSAELRAE
ncbi:hypothetical protein [Antarctobacter jejuensis]|uniref:hypothetical protein n=1 Tax=Antarctobacter jejuensis TaxID=1439938 RepID=UPI003FD3C25B